MFWLLHGLSAQQADNVLIGKVDMAFEGEIIKRGTEFMGAWQSAKDE